MQARWIAVAAAGVGLLLSATVVVSAQQLPQPWAGPDERPARIDISGSAGVLALTDWSGLVLFGSLSSAGLIEQVVARDLRVESDKAFGASVTYWEGRYGFRVQADYSKSSLKISNAPLSPSDRSTGPSTVPIKTWLYDARGVIGLLDYTPGRVVWPYGFFGLGGITYDLARTVTPPLTFITVAPPRSDGRDIFIFRGDGRQFVLTEDEIGVKTVFAFSFGIGTDLRVPLGPAGVGIRLELADRVANSPLNVTIRELSAAGFESDTRVRFGIVHHVTANAGLVIHFGR